MKRSRKVGCLLVPGLVVLALAGYVLYILTLAGEFRTIEPHFDGTCRPVEGAVGAEDIAILPDGSGAFVSSNDRAAANQGGAPNGAIYYYPLDEPGARPVNVTAEMGPGFAPHGIGLWEGEPSVLFVVNHPGADVHGDAGNAEGPAHTIEVFEVHGTSLKHRETITGESLITPNDVAPVGPESFYVTNDHGTGDKFWRQVEDYLRLRRSHVLFYDGSSFTRLRGGYGYANGIIASRDGEQIYLAAPTDRAVYVFDRDAATGELTLRREVDVDTAPDNISLDRDANLWIGAHPKALTLIAHMKDPTRDSPSQVLKLTADADGFGVREVMLTDGSDMSGSTVAARHGRRLLVGSVMEPVFLDCTMGVEE